MQISKIEVEITEPTFTNVKRGNVCRTRRITEEITADNPWDGEDLPKFGLFMHVVIPCDKDFKIFSIKVDRTFFDGCGEQEYRCDFMDGKCVYEVFMKLKQENPNEIDYICFSEWLDVGEFEDGEDADNYIYSCEESNIKDAKIRFEKIEV